ncbi:MAG TPA: GTP-binding protein [Acidimicrobiales bacterium]|nr:GTP-binding protein [Acidimicrobiales bacterium]
MELLRLATAGSVDDGKSTLIGRLLYDSKSVFEDQLESVEATSLARGDDHVDLSLLTDGLRAEREQGITIDVAYRYFSTPRRKFIIADTPGHTQHTRNMVTGCSTADLVIILVDARFGITEQTRRHAFLASLLRIPHFVICVNKMDLVGYDRRRFEAIRAEFQDFATRLEVSDLTFIPISALLGDNVVDRSADMAWYGGSSLLHHLEDVHIASDRNFVDMRFPIQRVVRPRATSGVRVDLHDYRGYAGQVAGGVLAVGDEIVVLPSGFTSTVEAVETADGPIDEAFPPMSVVVRIADDIDVSRGDMFVRPGNQPTIGQDISAMVSWMSDSALRPGTKLALKHTTNWVRALVSKISYRLDVNSLVRDRSADELGLNDIGRIELRTTAPLFYDEYRRNRTTGSFILVDESTNITVGAGMILPSQSD